MNKLLYVIKLEQIIARVIRESLVLNCIDAFAKAS